MIGDMSRPRVALTLLQCWHRVPGGTASAILALASAMQETGDVDLVGIGPWGTRLPPPPWTPPVPIWEKMGKLFPALMFRLWGHEPLMDFAFRGTIRDSTLDLREVPTVWSTVDPKTGATVSGTREEIEAVLGKHEVSAVSVGAGPPPEGL